jgi:hypothetical protein
MTGLTLLGVSFVLDLLARRVDTIMNLVACYWSLVLSHKTTTSAEDEKNDNVFNALLFWKFGHLSYFSPLQFYCAVQQ